MTQKPFILCDFDIAALTPGPSPKGRGEIFKTRSKRPSRIPYFVRSIIRAVRSRKYEVPSLKCRTCNTKHATPSGKPGARNTRRTGAIRLPSPLSFFIMHILGKISSWLKVNVGWDQRSAVPPRTAKNVWWDRAALVPPYMYLSQQKLIRPFWPACRRPPNDINCLRACFENLPSPFGRGAGGEGGYAEIAQNEWFVSGSPSP